MPARKRTWTPDKVRERIRTSMIVNRLEDHIDGKVEMSATQVSAALGLLRKTVPDLSATEFSGELRHVDVSDKAMTADEWKQAYSLGAPAGASESTH